MTRVGYGLCLSCLLRSGLCPEEPQTESFDAALAEIDVRDSEWRLGNYQILEEIGRGGMGVIYRARQRHSRRIVALKRILSYHSDSRDTLVRFQREAEAVASLDHPNILPIYEVGVSEDGLPFFSMKFAPGGSLLHGRKVFRDKPRQAVRLIAKVARAIEYANNEGILHRDLKPGNILLDGRGEPLVGDFGLAKWIDATSDLTRTMTVFGTPGYIAPEQVRGPAGNLTPAVDVYSLGAILFELLSGQPPFLGEHAIVVIHQAAEKQAPKLRSIVPRLDRDLETICARCLERDPAMRYRTAGDLAEDLERWLEDRPIIARPVLPPVRLWRWSRRNPKLAGSIAACLILAAVGLVEKIASSRLSAILQRVEIAQRSVAVTSFEDLDEILTTSNSARSMTSAFTAALTQAKGIQLSATPHQIAEDVDPWRSEDWKKIGEAGNARMVLSGSVRRREGKQRVAIHLIETATGSVVSTWLQDGESGSDIAKALTTKISNVVANTKGTSRDTGAIVGRHDWKPDAIGETNNPLARSYCDHGKEFLLRYNLADLDRAIESFRKAVEIDPNYAVAYAMLGSACQARAQTDPTRDWLAQADVATAVALRMAPMLPEAHRARGGTLRRHGRLRDSLDSYLTSYELEPATSRSAAMLGDTYEQVGRPDLALRWFEKVARRQTQPLFADTLGNAWTSLGDYDKAEKAYNSAIIFKPDLPVGLLGLSKLALFRGDYKGAREGCEQARAKYKDNPEILEMAALIEFFSRHFPAAEKLYREAAAIDRAGGVEFVGSVRYLSAIGFIQKLSGAHAKDGKALLEEAHWLDEKELLSAPDNLRHLYSLAANYAAQGKGEAATVCLDKAIAAGWIDYRSTMLDPRFDSIRNDETFKNALSRLINKVQEMRRPRPGR
ncbi:MAG TPA: FlgO family outer membrane protein [Chthoniobacterales bacterium]|nr:FlgO family outer membrane protein [Chthoniobacterales bacterium]